MHDPPHQIFMCTVSQQKPPCISFWFALYYVLQPRRKNSRSQIHEWHIHSKTLNERLRGNKTASRNVSRPHGSIRPAAIVRPSINRLAPAQIEGSYPVPIEVFQVPVETELDNECMNGSVLIGRHAAETAARFPLPLYRRHGIATPTATACNHYSAVAAAAAVRGNATATTDFHLVF